MKKKKTQNKILHSSLFGFLIIKAFKWEFKTQKHIFVYYVVSSFLSHPHIFFLPSCSLLLFLLFCFSFAI